MTLPIKLYTKKQKLSYNEIQWQQKLHGYILNESSQKQKLTLILQVKYL